MTMLNKIGLIYLIEREKFANSAKLKPEEIDLSSTFDGKSLEQLCLERGYFMGLNKAIEIIRES